MVDKPSDDAPTIEPLKDGPLKISGLTTFLNSRGENIATKKVIVLCRCGASKNKPFCDGTHVKIEAGTGRVSIDLDPGLSGILGPSSEILAEALGVAVGHRPLDEFLPLRLHH